MSNIASRLSPLSQLLSASNRPPKAHILAMAVPKRYHHPPAPTRLLSLTADAEAFKFARIRCVNGWGTVNVANSLV